MFQFPGLLWILDVNCEKSLWNDCLHILILFLSKCCYERERKRKADRNSRDKMQSDLSTCARPRNKKEKTDQLQTVCKTLEHILCLIFLCHLHRSLEPLSWALDCGFCLITRASLLFYVSTSSTTNADFIPWDSFLKSHEGLFTPY